MNSGALKGLRLLDLLPPTEHKKPNKEMVINALEKVDEFIQGQLSDDEIKDLQYDHISLEHTLCKVLRAADFFKVLQDHKVHLGKKGSITIPSFSPKKWQSSCSYGFV